MAFKHGFLITNAVNVDLGDFISSSPSVRGTNVSIPVKFVLKDTAGSTIHSLP